MPYHGWIRLWQLGKWQVKGGSGRTTRWGRLPEIEARGGRQLAAAKIGRCTRFGLGAMKRANSRPWRVSASTRRAILPTLPRPSGGMLQNDQDSGVNDGEFSSLIRVPDSVGIIPFPSPTNEILFENFHDLRKCMIEPPSVSVCENIIWTPKVAPRHRQCPFASDSLGRCLSVIITHLVRVSRSVDHSQNRLDQTLWKPASWMSQPRTSLASIDLALYR